MNKKGFRERLKERQEKINSLLCVGLDPLVEKVPEVIWKECKTREMAFSRWMRGVMNATAPFASMFKLQRAHWEAIDHGERALRVIVEEIHIKYPYIPVFLDCKRGDIDRTQRQYREAHFTLDGVDGMNYNGYMGVEDTLGALVDQDYFERALVGLGRTSNPKAWRFQDRIGQDGKTNWEFMIEEILTCSANFGVLDNAGVVMGAAYKRPGGEDIYSSHLERARKIVGDKLWFLIPGIGKQGGAVEETVRVAYRGPGSITINVSSDIDFASSGSDFAEAAARVAERYRNEMNQALQKG